MNPINFERPFFTIVQNIPDAICLMDTDFIIQCWNHGAEDMLGYRADEIIGKHISVIIPAEIAQREIDHCVTALDRDGKMSAYESVRLTKDGREILIELSAVALKTGDRVMGYASIMRDITERKQIEHELIESQANLRRVEETLKKAYAELEIKVQERTRELAKTNEELIIEVTERRRAEDLIRKSKTLSDALNSLGTVIHSSLDIDEIMQRVVKGAAKAMKVDATMIGVFEDGVFRVRYVYNMPEDFSRRILTSNEFRAMDYAARAKDAVAFNDAFNDERLNMQFLREIGIRSLLVAPVMTKDRIVGAMVFYELSKLFEFGEEHLDFARKACRDPFRSRSKTRNLPGLAGKPETVGNPVCRTPDNLRNSSGRTLFHRQEHALCQDQPKTCRDEQCPYRGNHRPDHPRGHPG